MPGVGWVTRFGRWAGRQRQRLRDGDRWQRWQPRLRSAAFTIGGAVLAVALAGRVEADIGPFDATVAARPSLGSQTTVRLAPLGTIVLDTHDWPMALELRVD